MPVTVISVLLPKKKEIKHFKADDVMEWKSVDLESQDIWGLSEKLTDGPCMLLLCQRANAFLTMRELAKYHNAISHRMSNSSGLYYSKTTLAAYHDILFFFPKKIDEKTVMEHAKKYLSAEVWPKLSEALARVAVERPKDPIKWLADHLAPKDGPQ